MLQVEYLQSSHQGIPCSTIESYLLEGLGIRLIPTRQDVWRMYGLTKQLKTNL